MVDSYEHLSVNAVELADALEGHMDEESWLLDLETGALLLVINGEVADEDVPEDWEESDRYMPISRIESHEAFGFMEDFVEELPEGEGARALARALGHSRPFRSFKDTLGDFPALRERWFKYHKMRMLAYAEQWLADNYPGAHLTQG